MKTSTVCASLLGGLAAAICLAACAVPSQPSGAVPHVEARRSLTAGARSFLYVLGGVVSTRHPVIEVFDAQDSSLNPQPIYTIAPKESGEYGLLAVTSGNDLFAVNYFANGAKLVIFSDGATKPKIDCSLDNVPTGTFIAGNTFYFTTQNYTIEEYALPLHAGETCPLPTKVLTDQRAQLRGQLGLLGLAVDTRGNLFDVWQSRNGQRIDKFPSGSKSAHAFASLKQTYGAFYVTSDSRNNVITNYGTNDPQSDAVAVLPPSGHPRQLFDPIPNGQYLGMAVARNSSELFAAKDYPSTTVSAYSYNPATGKVGATLRTFSANIWMYDQSIAVFSK